jgi:hypothetical protein
MKDQWHCLTSTGSRQGGKSHDQVVHGCSTEGAEESLALALVLFVGAALVAPAASMAQNLGTAPATGQAVQGQTAAQPEGAFLNAVNWVCNAICPVGAVIAVVATVLQWRSGRSWLPSALTAGGLICVSGILRLIEYFIQQGQAVA